MCTYVYTDIVIQLIFSVSTKYVDTAEMVVGFVQSAITNVIFSISIFIVRYSESFEILNNYRGLRIIHGEFPSMLFLLLFIGAWLLDVVN